VGLDVIYPVSGSLICRGFTHIVVVIPSIWMENFFFMVGHIFRLFDTDKAIALVFDLGSVKETANTQEAGLFGHLFTSTF